MKYSISIADYIILIFFLIISCSIGIVYAIKDRKKTKLDHAFVGNRKFKLFPIACSLLVTQISAILLLGMPAEFYTRGAQYWVYIIGQWLGVVVALYIFIPVFCNVGSPSSFTYIQKRFKSPILRSYYALTFMLTQLLYASVVLFAPCLAISLIVPIPITKLILIIGGVCTFYTSIGGFKTVIFTDVFQFLIIFISIIILMIKGVGEVGGLSKVYMVARQLGRMESTFNFDPNPTIFQSVWTIFFGIFFLTVRAYGVYQPSVQRYVAMPSIKNAQKSTYMVLPMQLLLIFILSSLGFIMLAAYQYCDPLTLKIIAKKDLLLAIFALQSFKDLKGLNGLFLACLFSGSLSTLSSSFNSLAAVCWKDFLIPLMPSVMVKVGKNKALSTILPAVIAMIFGMLVMAFAFLAQNIEGVLNASLGALGVFGGQELSIFLLGMFVTWVNYKGMLAGKFCADIICMLINMGFMKHAKHISPPYLPMPAPQISSSHTNFSSANTTLFCSELNRHIISTNFTIPLQAFAKQNVSLSTSINPIGDGLGPYLLFKIYSISYLLITPIGFFLCTIIALIVSWPTGGTKDTQLKFDKKLLMHPWIVKNI